VSDAVKEAWIASEDGGQLYGYVQTKHLLYKMTRVDGSSSHLLFFVVMYFSYSVNIEDWDMSQVFSFENLFEGKSDFNADLGCWNVSTSDYFVSGECK
jgi:hypothetical protein